MDGQNEDELLLSLLRELRRRNDREDSLRAIITKATDTMAVVNQTCVAIHAAIERVEARLSLMQAGVE